MTTERVRKMHQARPFEPFEIHLADGRRLPVRHPEFLSFSASGRTIVVSLPDDTFESVDLLLVTSLKARSDGSSRKWAAAS